MTEIKSIDFEAHFYTKDCIRAMVKNKGFPRLIRDEQAKPHRLWYTDDVWVPLGDTLLNKLLDLGKGRLKNMNAAEIDVQILSLTAPGVEQFDAKMGTVLAKRANDELSEVIQKHPDRFLGFAALAPKSPGEAIDELERAVKDLGFKGWKTHSNYGDTYLDAKEYWPILEKAEKLDVPVYIHPTVPHIPQLRTYGFALAGASFGFGFDTAMCMMRLILSGVFDKHPGLKIILGHLGEAFPFLLKRIDFSFVKPWLEGQTNLVRKPSECLKKNTFVITSGDYFQPAFICTYQAMGIDRILLGTDYPYDYVECIPFLNGLPIPQEDKDKIRGLNAKSLNIE